MPLEEQGSQLTDGQLRRTGLETESARQRGKGDCYALAMRAFLFLGVMLLVVGLLVYTSQVHYLLFHTAVELFSVVIAGLVFVIALNTYAGSVNYYFLFLGVAYGAVAVVDFFHTLAYKGMNVFPAYDANLPTQLWIAARYLESLSLLVAPFFSRRGFRLRVIMLLYAVVLLLLLVSAFMRFFPVCYVEGVGLTTFKKISEYLICLILLAAVANLYRDRSLFSREVFSLLVAAYLTTIAAELAFTFYVSVYGLSNLVGHLFKVVSFYLLYLAIVRVNLREPQQFLYWQLEQSKSRLAEDLEKFWELENALRATRDFFEKIVNTAPALILGLDREGKVVFLNGYGEEFLKQDEEMVRGKKWFSNFVPLRYQQQAEQWFAAALQTKQIKNNLEIPVLTGSGEEKVISWHCDFWEDEKGEISMVIATGIDISERKAVEEKLEMLSYVDGLTGIANRRYFDQRLEEEWRRAFRYKQWLAVLMCDIDYFKLYNDTYGHLKGDECLQEVARTLKMILKRPGDVVARYGGEEFGVILPATHLPGAQLVGERLRQGVEALSLFHSQAPLGVVTISVGVAAVVPAAGISQHALLKAADTALYAAKAKGRNRVETVSIVEVSGASDH